MLILLASAVSFLDSAVPEWMIAKAARAAAYARRMRLVLRRHVLLSAAAWFRREGLRKICVQNYGMVLLVKIQL